MKKSKCILCIKNAKYPFYIIKTKYSVEDKKFMVVCQSCIERVFKTPQMKEILRKDMDKNTFICKNCKDYARVSVLAELSY